MRIDNGSAVRFGGATRCRALGLTSVIFGFAIACEPAEPAKSATDQAADMERTRCGPDLDEKALGPVLDGRAVQDVQPLYSSVESAKNGSDSELRGVTIRLEALPGVTAEWLDRALECHSARRVLSRVPASSVPNDPFWVPGNVVDIDAQSAHDGFLVAVRGATPDVGREILARANAFSAAHQTSSAPVAATSTDAPVEKARGETHRLVIAAAACWFGGSWADALGVQDSTKASTVEARCHDLERRVWGGAEDKVHYEQLRALEANAIADVIARVHESAKEEGFDAPRREAIVKLTTALAEAQKELMLARRAGDRVKRDLDHEPERLSADETDAVAPLRAHSKFDALLGLDAGQWSRESHALALFCALDRVEMARGLPKHLKVYAVGDTFHVVFGVAIPDVPQDATKKLVPGTWLRFLSDTATAAGYPVSVKAKTPRERDALAWAGMLRGFADKLKTDADTISPSTELSHVAVVALHRLEAEYNAQQAAEETVRPKTSSNAL